MLYVQTTDSLFTFNTKEEEDTIIYLKYLLQPYSIESILLRCNILPKEVKEVLNKVTLNEIERLWLE